MDGRFEIHLVAGQHKFAVRFPTQAFKDERTNNERKINA